MSAFILDNAHISALVSLTAPAHQGDSFSYYWQGTSPRPTDQELGQKLVDENYRSVYYRYQDNPEIPREARPYRFEVLIYGKRYSPVELIKACHCYEYQACEHPEWPESEARAIVKSLERRAIRRLDGYEDAPWPIYDDPNAPDESNVINLTDLMIARGF